MRVIVVNDSDGHAHVFPFNVSNLKKCLQHLIDIGRVEDTGLMYEAAVKSNDSDAWIEKVEELFNEECVLDRSGGGHLYFVDVQEDWEFNYGPFD